MTSLTNLLGFTSKEEFTDKTPPSSNIIVQAGELPVELLQEIFASFREVERKALPWVCKDWSNVLATESHREHEKYFKPLITFLAGNLDRTKTADAEVIKYCESLLKNNEVLKSISVLQIKTDLSTHKADLITLLKKVDEKTLSLVSDFCKKNSIPPNFNLGILTGLYLKLEDISISQNDLLENSLDQDTAVREATLIYISERFDGMRCNIVLELAVYEDFDKALETTMEIYNPQLLSTPLTAIAKGLIKNGYYEKGLAIANSIPEKSTKIECLILISKELTRQKAYDKAIKAVKMLKQPSNDYYQNKTAKKLAKKMASLGACGSAIEMLKIIPKKELRNEKELIDDIVTELIKHEAFEEAAEVTQMLDMFSRTQSCTAITHALITLKRYKEAIIIAKALDCPYNDVDKISEKLADIGVIEFAILAAKEIPDDTQKSLRLHKIGKVLLHKGDFETLLQVMGLIMYRKDIYELLSDVLKALKTHEDIEKFTDVALSNMFFDRWYLLSIKEVVNALVNIGSYQKALEIALNLRDDDTRNELFEKIITIFITQKGYAKAIEGTNLITEDWMKLKLFKEIADKLVQNGCDNNEEVIKAVYVSAEILKQDNAQVLEPFAMALIKLGMLKPALEMALSIVDKKDRTVALEGMSEYLMKLEDFHNAIVLAIRIPSLKRRSLQLCDIVKALAAKGDFDMALTIPQMISDEEYMSIALSYIAKGLMNLGHYPRAKEVAQTIPIEKSKAVLLEEIVKHASKVK